MNRQLNIVLILILLGVTFFGSACQARTPVTVTINVNMEKVSMSDGNFEFNAKVSDIVSSDGQPVSDVVSMMIVKGSDAVLLACPNGHCRTGLYPSDNLVKFLIGGCSTSETEIKNGFVTLTCEK